MERICELVSAAKISAKEGYSEEWFIKLMTEGQNDQQIAFALEKFRKYVARFAERVSRKTPSPIPSKTAEKMVKVGPYLRAGTLSVEFVLTNAGKLNVQTPFGVDINFSSWRIICYATKGVQCTACGLKGTFFAVEKFHRENTTKFHLNLYHRNANDRDTMITVDHIIPKSAGGGNKLNNLQVMCFPCNESKGSKMPDMSEVA